MFDISFLELMVIGVIALLVIGPQRLPKVATQAGRWFGKAQRFMRKMRMDLEDELHHLEMQEMIKNQELQDAKALIEDTSKDLQDSMRELDKTVAEQATEVVSDNKVVVSAPSQHDLPSGSDKKS